MNLVRGVPTPLIEFPVDTARTITSLLWSGTLSRYPNLRFIFSHGGGALPMVIERVSALAAVPLLRERVPEGPAQVLSKLWVDTATVTNRPALGQSEPGYPIHKFSSARLSLGVTSTDS